MSFNETVSSKDVLNRVLAAAFTRPCLELESPQHMHWAVSTIFPVHWHDGLGDELHGHDAMHQRLPS